jgi:autotransporter translocation and assembly factor TamB
MAGSLRRWVVRPFVWLVALLAVLALALHLLLASGFTRERVRRLVEARASEGLGREVRIGRLDLGLLPLRLAVEELRVAGDRPGSEPFATLARGEVEADLSGLRARVLRLRRVALVGLELRLELRADGSDNIPRPPRAGGDGLTVRVDGLTIDDSRVLVDEERAPFALAAEGVLARVVDSGRGELDGSVASEAVRLVLPGATPFEVALTARVRLAGERLEIRRALVTSREASADLAGEIGLRAPVRVALAGGVEVAPGFLARRGWIEDGIDGEVSFAGSFTSVGPQWEVTGEVTSPRFEVVDFDLTEVRADARVDRQRAELSGLSARWADGDLAGSFAVELEGDYPAHLELVVAEVDLDDVLARFEVPVRDLRGVASGPLVYRFDLRDAARGAGAGDFTIAAATYGPDALPVTGRVGLALAEGRVRLDPILWEAAGQRIAGEGEYDLTANRGAFDLRIASEDLGELVRRLPFVEEGALWAPTDGTGELALRVELEPGGRAVVDVELAAAALVAPGLRAARAAGKLRATADEVWIERLRLVRDGAALELAGTLSLAADEALALTLEIAGWPVEEAAPWLPFTLPLAGPVSGELRLGGTVSAPAGTLDATIAPVELAGLAGESLAVRLEWDAERVELEQARLELAAGEVHARGRLTLADERLDFTVASPALALDRAPLDRVGQGALAGALALDARLGGTLARPELELTGAASDATLFGEALAPDAQPRISTRWREERLAARVELPGIVVIDGGGALDLEGESRLRFTLASAGVERLAELLLGEPVAELEGDLAGEIDVVFAPEVDLEARLVLPEVALVWRGEAIRSLEPVELVLDGDGLRVASLYLGVGDGDDEVFLAGRIGLAEGAPLDLRVQAELSAGWLAAFVGDLAIDGRVELLSAVRGTLAAPEWNGQAAWQGGRYIPPGLPHRFERGRALLLLYPRALVLDRLSGDFAGGTVEASGRVDLPPAGEVSYRMEIAGRRMSLRWPAGWQLRGDADLTLVSTRSGRQLAGQVDLDRVFYFQDLALSPGQILQRLLTRSRETLPETDELLATTALNVAISAPRAVRVRNNLADLTASADLALRGTLARPVVFGDVRTEAGGKVTYLGNVYRVERGVVTFTDPTRIDPQLDLVASTRIDQYEVQVIVVGRMSRPTTSFAADPPLPDLEILGLLTTGSPLEPALTTLTGVGTDGQAAAAAEALLYGQAASLVGARVGQLFGFDQVRVEPITSGDAVSTARVTVGKRLSRNVMVTYSVDPSSTAQQILQVEWRVSEGLVVVLTQNGNESYAADVRWERRF